MEKGREGGGKCRELQTVVTSGLCNEGGHRDDGGGRDAGEERASESKAVEIHLV